METVIMGAVVDLNKNVALQRIVEIFIGNKNGHHCTHYLFVVYLEYKAALTLSVKLFLMLWK